MQGAHARRQSQIQAKREGFDSESESPPVLKTARETNKQHNLSACGTSMPRVAQAASEKPDMNRTLTSLITPFNAGKQQKFSMLQKQTMLNRHRVQKFQAKLPEESEIEIVPSITPE